MAQSERDTYKYDFLDKEGKLIHSGVTTDLKRREGELKRQHSQDGYIKQVGGKTTRKAARAWAQTEKKA